MFADECQIEVVAGRGGDGCVSFRREKFVPHGGPDGGDGGDGGDVRLRVNPHLRTLSHLRHTPAFRAGSGKGGMGKKMTGARGAEAIVEVPPGTSVSDAADGRLIADAVDSRIQMVLVRGGRGGRGNVRFKRSVRRTPRFAERGEVGQSRTLQLTLKLLADVGLVGLPNAGKSTLLSRISNAKPRIADYPFTTLEPVLGIVPVGEWSTLVLADLPGLIEGAHEGKGLGQRFLRHIERTRVLLLLIEAIDPDPRRTFGVLRHELERWSAKLAGKEFLVCYTKGDLLREDGRDALPSWGETKPLFISAVTGEGVERLLEVLNEKVLAATEELAEPLLSTGGSDRAGAVPGAALAWGSDQRNTPCGGTTDPDRSWPTKWIIPRRPGARTPQQMSEEEKNGGEEA